MKKRGRRDAESKVSDVLVIDAINAMKKVGREGIESDVEGSYRGEAEDGRRPMQDADDL